jgi:uncharacterized protein
MMKTFLLSALCLVLALPCLAQNADDPATKDDVILLFRTMHSHDMVQRVLEVQSQTMRQMLQEQLDKEKMPSADSSARMQKVMDQFIKGMPIDEMTEAMIPAYQKHFTHGDIEAMNAFYSSPVGQKVIETLPEVTQEGLQAMMPLLYKYLNDWKGKMQQELKQETNPGSAPKTPPASN